MRSVTGLALRASLPGARIGDVVRVRRRGEPLLAEIVGFDAGEVVAMPLGDMAGVGPDDVVESSGAPLQVRVGEQLLGRVVDGLGRPLESDVNLNGATSVLVDRAPPPALDRQPIDRVVPTGIRAVDGFLTLGLGQRIGLFAGSGVGKSTLLGSLARGAKADVVVVALVGERGREVGEFLNHALGDVGRKRSVVVVATSDAPALERLRAAQVATAVSEYFRDQGKSVLLLVDSITRFARAQREVGLAAGEPPARRGYPPSVFAMLPKLLERTGRSAAGSITAVYTVLVEGSDMDEPIADEVRGIVDGHVVLDRRIAARGHYPAIDIPVSLSRVMDGIVAPEHRDAARTLRRLLGAYEEKRDLIALGAYAKGGDRNVDQAIAAMPELLRVVQQDAHQTTPFEETSARLVELAKRFG